MDEQAFINLFFNYMQSPLLNKRELERLIKDIERVFPKSAILQYYIGFYYDQIGKTDLSKKKFKECIKLMPFFSQPYLHLGNTLLAENKCEEAERILSQIFGVKTIDPKSGSLARCINLADQMQIGVMLQTAYHKINKRKESGKVLHKMKKMLESPENKLDKSDSFYALWSKQIYLALSNATRTTDPEKSVQYLLDGCQIIPSQNPQVTAVHKQLLDKLLVDMHYSMRVSSIFPTVSRMVSNVYSQFAVPKFHYKSPSKQKIHIAYLSPDFNKNAVGLFLTPFLQHFDKNTFHVYVFYTNACSDEFTNVFKSYPGITWVDAAGMDNATLFNSIKFEHNIDILVDLISAGVDNRMELMAMGPANVIINYLGYPGTSFLPTVTHRLVDGITDPPNYHCHEKSCTETLLRMPRCFLCFSMFNNINDVPLAAPFPSSSNKIYAGIMNKSLKYHPQIISAWKAILHANKNLVLCIKSDECSVSPSQELYDFPQDQIQIIPFVNSLEEYLQQFNRFHFCLDTFPYSGTTTTCTSLYMGVPVFTIYDPSNPHVSNVSASIIMNTDPDLASTFVTKDTSHYVDSVTEYIKGHHDHSLEFRKSLRQKFTKLMDPQKFMKEYEHVLLDVLKKSTFDGPSDILSLGVEEFKCV